MKNTQKSLKFSKKNIFLGTAGVLIVVLVSWWTFFNFMPRPLGGGLEYLGKKDYGGGLFYSDSDPYAEYYYATDMDIKEIKSYFPKTEAEVSTEFGSSISYTIELLRFKTDQNSFVITYYSDAKAIVKEAKIRDTNKKYVVSIAGFDYETAKATLQ